MFVLSSREVLFYTDFSAAKNILKPSIQEEFGLIKGTVHLKPGSGGRENTNKEYKICVGPPNNRKEIQ